MLKVMILLTCLLSLALANPVSETFLIPVFFFIFNTITITVIVLFRLYKNVPLVDFLQMDPEHKRHARSDSSSNSGSDEVRTFPFTLFCACII